METKSKILYYGPWQIPYKATNVLCSDGKRRTAKLASEPIPASVQVKGKTVSGFITSDDNDIYFCQNLYGRNGHLLPDKRTSEYKQEG